VRRPVISALGVYLHQIWMLWLGSASSAASAWAWATSRRYRTLVKWFPDRRGMATGMAIMGFGRRRDDRRAAGRSPDEVLRDATSVGVWETFLTMPPSAVFMPPARSLPAPPTG